MLRIFNFILITSLFIFIGSKASYTSTILMSENFEDKNELKVSDYDGNWIIEKLDNGNSVYCNKIKNIWTGFNFGEKIGIITQSHSELNLQQAKLVNYIHTLEKIEIVKENIGHIIKNLVILT